MKIGEVEVGKEYGALDSPKRSFSNVDPRQVVVVNIVEVETKTHSRYTSAKTTRKVKRVEVEVLNDPEQKKDSWRWDVIEKSARGDVLVIEARQLVGPWTDLNKGILKRVAEEEKATARKEDIERRLKALGFNLGWQSVSVSVATTYGDRLSEVKFKGEHIDKLLAILEAK